MSLYNTDIVIEELMKSPFIHFDSLCGREQKAIDSPEEKALSTGRGKRFLFLLSF